MKKHWEEKGSEKYRPVGLRDVVPYLIVENAGKLIEFIAIVFDADVLDCADGKDRKIANAILQVGDSIIEVADSNEEWAPQRASLHVYVPDIDTVFDRAIQAGGKALFSPSDQGFGERMGGVQDPFGNQWFIATLVQNGK